MTAAELVNRMGAGELVEHAAEMRLTFKEQEKARRK